MAWREKRRGEEREMRKSRGTATTNLIGFYLRAPEETTRRLRWRRRGVGAD